jgi:hypothetical protein
MSFLLFCCCVVRKTSTDPDLEIERLITAETSAGTMTETSSVWTRESQPVGGTQLSVTALE